MVQHVACMHACSTADGAVPQMEQSSVVWDNEVSSGQPWLV